MMLDQISDCGADFRTIDIGIGGTRSGLRKRGTEVRLFVFVELGVRLETVLKIVDSEIGGLAKSHRTEVAGDFQSACMRCLDCCPEFGARD